MQSPQEARRQMNMSLRYNRVLKELHTNFPRMIRVFPEPDLNSEPSPSSEIQRRTGNQPSPSPNADGWTNARLMCTSSTIGR